jgi:hypothetical protein
MEKPFVKLAETKSGQPMTKSACAETINSRKWKVCGAADVNEDRR